MRGAHAARAVLLIISCCACRGVAAGQDVQVQKTASAVIVPAAALAELEPVSTPGGMVDLCRRDSSFCAPAGPAPRLFMLTPANWKMLAAVNNHVNHTIASTTDKKLYGKDEYWTIPTTAGDCEDYVLLKRKILMAMGVPEASLLITVVHDENDEGHAVLTVPSTDGDVILDNRRDEMLHWWQTGYSFIKRQSEANPDVWVSLGHEKLQATNIASGPGLP